MPIAEFSNNDLINTIVRTTGHKPTIIVKKEITKEGFLVVVWK
jgi:hypothetical protein